MAHRVVLEVAPRRAFAAALDWPGWCRSGRTADDALGALQASGPRYAMVARRARIAFATGSVEVVERLPGNATTEFGAPGVAAALEDVALDVGELRRLLALLRACWSALDDAAGAAAGVELRTGPRGGGRDLAKIIEHVRAAEVSYLSKLGSRAPAGAADDPTGAMALHATFADAVTARATGASIPDPSRTRSRWSPRYAVRRAAWHVLDHAWEIEDRSG